MAPGNDTTETTNPGNNANYTVISGSDYAIGSPYYRTVAGEFELSDSPYGTFDQGGNVWEWNETVFPDAFSGPGRGLRGGSFFGDSSFQHASAQTALAPRFLAGSVGFRVASIPEPSTLLLVGLCDLLLRRRLRVRL